VDLGQPLDIESAMHRMHMGSPTAMEDRECQVVDVAVDDVELVRALSHGVRGCHMHRDRIEQTLRRPRS
jgi:hypothetical protein